MLTITTNTKFALIPKRCDVCGKLFWLEEYNIFFREVGIEHYELKQKRCLKCGKYARYPVSNFLFDAIRFIDEGKTEVAREEIIYALRKAGANFDEEDEEC